MRRTSRQSGWRCSLQQGGQGGAADPEEMENADEQSGKKERRRGQRKTKDGSKEMEEGAKAKEIAKEKEENSKCSGSVNFTFGFSDKVCLESCAADAYSAAAYLLLQLPSDESLHREAAVPGSRASAARRAAAYREGMLFRSTYRLFDKIQRSAARDWEEQVALQGTAQPAATTASSLRSWKNPLVLVEAFFGAHAWPCRRGIQVRRGRRRRPIHLSKSNGKRGKKGLRDQRQVRGADGQDIEGEDEVELDGKAFAAMQRRRPRRSKSSRQR